MNPNPDNRDDTPHEEQWMKLFASTNHDAAQPDRSFLDQLREQSTAAFLFGKCII